MEAGEDLISFEDVLRTPATILPVKVQAQSTQSSPPSLLDDDPVLSAPQPTHSQPPPSFAATSSTRRKKISTVRIVGDADALTHSPEALPASSPSTAESTSFGPYGTKPRVESKPKSVPALDSSQGVTPKTEQPVHVLPQQVRVASARLAQTAAALSPTITPIASTADASASTEPLRSDTVRPLAAAVIDHVWRSPDTHVDPTLLCKGSFRFFDIPNKPSNRSSNAKSRLVKLGTKQLDFTCSVDRDVLSTVSVYFRVAFAGRSVAKSYVFTRIDGNILALFNGWIVHGMKALRSEDMLSLLKLWVSGEAVGADQLIKDVIDIIVTRYSENAPSVSPSKRSKPFVFFSLQDVAYVYNHTLPGAKMRALVAQLYSTDTSAIAFGLENVPDEVNKEFLFDLIKHAKDVHYRRVSGTPVSRKQWSPKFEHSFAPRLESVASEIANYEIAYQSIVALDLFQEWSPDELRVADYKVGRGNSVRIAVSR